MAAAKDPHVVPLRTIGIMDLVVKSADPCETDVGRLRMDEIFPKRVRDR